MQVKNDILSILELRLSSWKKMRRVVGYIVLFINKIKKQMSNKSKVAEKILGNPLEMSDLKDVEEKILRLIHELTPCKKAEQVSERAYTIH